jgi:hypothetical protein
LWIQRDPHAQAFAVLHEPRSLQMTQILGWAEAPQEARCLACHSIDATRSELVANAKHTLHDGVGCEACHGAAEQWLDPHKWARWSTMTIEEKSSLGFRDLKDVVERTQLCTECHVGSAGRDVYHDLIAAGHPRMTFEMSAYHANLPKHWQREIVPRGELDARLWITGQVAAARSSVELLAQRAGDAKAPWPEFAEYDCFACHHDLADPSWRQAESGGPRNAPPGSAEWGSWYFAMLPLLVDQDRTGATRTLAALREEMQRPLPDRAKVKALAKDAAAELEELARRIAGESMNAAAQERWLARLSDVEGFELSGGWDVVALRFLGCAAMNFSTAAAADSGRAKPQAADVEENLALVRALLRFSTDSAETSFASPRDYTSDRRQDLREALDAIHQRARADAE